MAESSTQSIRISDNPSAVAEVITDFLRYPEWINDVKSTEVLEEFEDGYAHLVRFQLDAGVLKDAYELRYEYADDFSRISWVLDKPSSVQKSQTGSYDLSDNGDGTTTVVYTLAVDLSIPMLGMFKRKAEKMIMDSALNSLKRRVEESA
ncbi:MAG TPA: SRPBCC family protein [Candidatus Stackebrandtia excrementipullorum]|nr:SRPBCC family protein [Candidatus Stackebrandtia excrementipullorum]